MNTPSVDDLSADALPPRLAALGSRLHALGLDGLIDGLLDAADPLAPLGAELLYAAQPVLSLTLPHAAIGELADRLAEPGGIAWLRRCLGFDTDGENIAR